MYKTLYQIAAVACAIPVVIFSRAICAALRLDYYWTGIPSGYDEVNSGQYISMWEHAAPWVWFGLVTLAVPAMLLFFAWCFKPIGANRLEG